MQTIYNANNGKRGVETENAASYYLMIFIENKTI